MGIVGGLASLLMLALAMAGLFGPVIAGVYLMIRLNARAGGPHATNPR
ncbi:MAG: hypothetical protein IPJ14_10595 [Kineosporiaceae bacterium]|nr:hypothetical protein [Kineosporiaceae bacterium]MBK7623075.1 hypothetical protein [Kineosporiaceae bacterium]